MIRRRLKHIWSQQPHQCIPLYPAICWWSLEPVHVASGIKWVSQKYLKIQHVEIQSKDASENDKFVLPLSGTTFVVSDCDFWCYSCDAWLWFCVFFTGTRRKKRAWPGQNSGRQTVLAIFRVLIGSISDMRKVMFELIVLGFLGLVKVKSLVFPLPPRPWQPWDPPRPDKRKWPPLGAGTAEQELAAPKFKIRDKSMLKKYQKMPGVMHFPPGHPTPWCLNSQQLNSIGGLQWTLFSWLKVYWLKSTCVLASVLMLLEPQHCSSQNVLPRTWTLIFLGHWFWIGLRENRNREISVFDGKSHSFL